MTDAEDDRNYRTLHLTGGPCAGKSSSMAHLTAVCSERGIRVLFVPEVATPVITGGVSDFVDIRDNQPELYARVQGSMIGMARAQREQWTALAAAFAPEPVLVVFDRAELDSRAYMTEEMFWAVCDQLGITSADMWNGYDAVVHMVTAADGAENYYTTANNSARAETPDQARAADARTLAAVNGHPHLRIADNSGSFQDKLDRVAQVALGLFGIPSAVEDERKWLLATPPVSLPDNVVEIEIVQTYLRSGVPGVEERVRRRSWRGQDSWIMTRKDRRGEGAPLESERLLTPAEAQELLTRVDGKRAPIRKTRYCYPANGCYCELDRVDMSAAGEPDLWLLEIEKVHADDEVAPPVELDIEREVTGDSRYGMHGMALYLARNAAPSGAAREGLLAYGISEETLATPGTWSGLAAALDDVFLATRGAIGVRSYLRAARPTLGSRTPLEALQVGDITRVCEDAAAYAREIQASRSGSAPQ